MWRHAGSLILVLMLGACSPTAAPSFTAEHASPAPPSVHSATGGETTATPQLAPTSSSAPASPSTPAATAPTAYAQRNEPGTSPAVGQQTAPPASRKEIAWHGVRFQYDPQRFLFAEATPSTTAAWAAADLTQTPNPCLQFPNGADCFPDDIGLRLYSRDGLSFWAWLAQQKIVYSYTPEGDFVETHIAGQPAVAWPGDSIFGGSYTAYAMPLGEDVLLIGGWGLESFVSTIELEHPPAAALAAGQTVMTTPGHVWELWSDAAAGERLVERPLLYGGAYVTILAVEPQAVQVRTSEGLTGWIHAAAADALIAQVAPLGEQARFIPYSPAKIADGHTLPLRESPRSTAPQRDPLLESGQEVEVIGARGDWLQVYVFPNRDGSPRTYEQGWVRWYYDGTEYIDVGGR